MIVSSPPLLRQNWEELCSPRAQLLIQIARGTLPPGQLSKIKDLTDLELATGIDRSMRYKATESFIAFSNRLPGKGSLKNRMKKIGKEYWSAPQKVRILSFLKEVKEVQSSLP